MERILIVDDDDAIRRTLELHLTEQRFEVLSADTLAKARELWRERDPDIVVLDLKLPDGEGTTLLEEFARAGTEAIVVMVTGHQDMDYAIRAMKAGAFNYIHKPLNIDELDVVLQRARQQIRARSKVRTLETEHEEFRPGKIAGQSRVILEVHKQIGLAAKSRVNVLIFGESGTGKELVARAIHQNSTPDEPFVAVNCSAIVPTLLESELFGHERGAFTGAHQRKIGKLELAGTGTLFLDEIGDLSPELQSKLLRVVQERTFERVGGNQTLKFEARITAATNRRLEEMVQRAKFREDLYFRLKVLEIVLPPLRERKEDIPNLVQHLLEKINRDLHRHVTRVPDNVMVRLMQHDWPGNVRELENVLTQAVLRSPGQMLALDFWSTRPIATGEKRELKSLADIEKEHIEWVLAEVGGHLGKACEVLGITRPTLRKKMEDYGISVTVH